MDFVSRGATDLATFDRILTPSLREFYRERGVSLASRQPSSETLSSLAMAVDQPLVVFPSLLLSAPQPDGIFTDFSPGAIFESKLCDPGGDSLFRASMAAYALAAEQIHHHEYELGIVLHTGWPDSEVGVYTFPIADSDASKVLFNLDRLRQLVDISWARWTQTRHGKRRGSKPQTWEQLLTRPRVPKPPRERLGPCPACRFRQQCWSDGRWQ